MTEEQLVYSLSIVEKKRFWLKNIFSKLSKWHLILSCLRHLWPLDGSIALEKLNRPTLDMKERLQSHFQTIFQPF